MMLHPNFKLNGQSFSKEELIEIGYSLIKEGEEYEISIGDFLLDWLDNSKVVITHTSGSTGVPKQISLKKEHMVNSALGTGDFFKLNSGDSALLCLPADFIAGKMMLVRAMVLGLELDIVEPSSNLFIDDTKTYDFSAMVPMQVENTLEKLHQIKTLIIGGAPVSYSLREKLQDISADCFETYGMTETITHIAVKKINKQANVRSSAVETYFKALPEIIFSLDDRECLVIKAPKVSDETIVTNDLIELIDDKSFKWSGRYDNVINSGGIKLIPEQIEAKLIHLLNNRFFLAGHKDEILGQKLILVLEGNQDKTEIKKLIDSSKLLLKYEKPKQIFFVSEFVETASGKVNRRKTLEKAINSLETN